MVIIESPTPAASCLTRHVREAYYNIDTVFDYQHVAEGASGSQADPAAEPRVPSRLLGMACKLVYRPHHHVEPLHDEWSLPWPLQHCAESVMRRSCDSACMQAGTLSELRALAAAWTLNVRDLGNVTNSPAAQLCSAGDTTHAPQGPCC